MPVATLLDRMLQTREINDPLELAEVRLAWSLLLPQTRGANFFQTLDWLEVYWRHFGHAQKLRVLVVSDSGRPIGILPLVVRREATRLGSLRYLTYPLDDWGSFYGSIGPNPAVTLWEGMRHLARTPRDWDLVDLRWINVHGQDAGRTSRAMDLAGLQPHQTPLFDSAIVEMDAGWDAYWASRKSEWRSNVRRCERRADEQGQITYVRYRPQGAAHADGDPRWDLYEACEQVACRSWQGSSRSGTTLTHDAVRDYLRDAHEGAAKAGGVDLNLLYVDGAPAAFAYNYHYLGHVFGLRSGFDPNVPIAGLGTILLGRTLRDSFDRGDHTYDLGANYLEPKRYWKTRLETSYRVTHYPALGLRAQALRLKRKVATWWSAAEVA